MPESINDLIVTKLQAQYPGVTHIGDLIAKWKTDTPADYVPAGDAAFNYWTNYAGGLDDSITIPEGWGEDTWFAARDNADAQLVNIGVWGDSIPQGYYSSNFQTKGVFGKLITDLQTEYGDGGSGFHSLRNATGVGATGATYLTVGGSWTTFAYGINETTLICNTPGAGTLTFPNVRGTVIEIRALIFNGLPTSYDVVVDGGAPVTKAVSGAGFGIQIDTIAVAAGSHSVVITPSAASYAQICGVSGRDPAGIVGHNMGFAGRGSAAGAVTTAMDVGKTSGSVSTTDFDLDLLLICVGVNDIGFGTTKAAFKANLERLVGLADGADVAVVLAHKGDLTDGSDLYTDYEEAVSEVQTALDPQVAVYNAWADFDKSYAVAEAEDFWGTTNSALGEPGDDPVHPSDFGHAHKASRLYDLVTQ